MKKVKLYYKTFQLEMEIAETEYTKLMKQWTDHSNRGGNLTVTTKHGTRYDIDLTKVELIETNN